ncbi:MAG: hypothetical protein PHH84_08485 [Oscillospiraceae bacterium]|nr:hypothetical protein [Oscillospiraceae bacterium]MDD4414695.1 hypothetical protein [Oscillospiraceae bacterium]
MDSTGILQQITNFKKARSNLLLVIAFTTINSILTVFNSSFYLLFSASAPQLILQIARLFADESNSNTSLLIGLIMAFGIILIYFLCWYFTERKRAMMLAALILFSIDSLIFVIMVLIGGFDISILIDVGFHAWVLYYLVLGVIAWSKLRGIGSDYLETVLKEGAQSLNTIYPQNSGMNEQAGINTSIQGDVENAQPVIDGSTSLHTDDNNV